MLNMISSCEIAEMNAAAIVAAATPRLRYGLGASALLQVATPASARVAVSARPCTDEAAAAGAAAQHVVLADSGLAAAKQQLISKLPVFTTRITVSGGGVLGPHTAREPV